MKYFSLPTDRDKILMEIEKRGWSAQALEADDLDWWLAEAYKLTSLSHPSDKIAFLLFKVDPQFESEKAKEEQVWSVSVCEGIPEYYGNARDNIVAGRLEIDLPHLLAALELIRDK
ncbi:MAG: hypothetical protein IPM63_14900 [Acidobacteriota bacterium]|nr:MAG: hypothetical protein IPM63_14900 [Acidobacteriota bacterium]